MRPNKDSYRTVVSVANEVGAVPQFEISITDSVDGFLIHDRNIDEFAEKVCLLMSDEQLRKKMGKAGIKSSQRYQGSLIMPKWDNLFKMLKENSSTD